MGKQMTPLLRPLRNNSGTLYVFPSANEDIDLNINARGNRVALSYYALLNLPETDTYSVDINPKDNDDASARAFKLAKNYFNFTNIPSIHNAMNGDVNLDINGKITAALQNYMMNFETMLIDQPNYDYTANKTVSERVFWKFLKETGAVRWVRKKKSGLYQSTDGKPVFEEYPEYDASGNETGYKRVVQCFGKISGGNSRSTDFGMYNETYVNIPTSYGAGPQFFTVNNEDNNYKLNSYYFDNTGYLTGRDNVTQGNIRYTINEPWGDEQSISDENRASYNLVVDASGNLTNKSWYTDILSNSGTIYYTEKPVDSNNIPQTSDRYEQTIAVINGSDKSVIRKFRRSTVDGIELVKDLDNFQDIIGTDSDVFPESYDDLNISCAVKNNFEFNAILLYYSIYDKESGDELATNLFGIMFLNGVSDGKEGSVEESTTGETMSFVIPTYIKKQSSGSESNKTFGTGFSFRVNVRSLQIYDNTEAFIKDSTTTDALYADDFNDVIYDLNQSVQQLSKNTRLVQLIANDYQNIISKYNDLQVSIQSLTQKINLLTQNKFNVIDASNISSDDIDVKNLKVTDSLEVDCSWNVSDMTATDIQASKIKTDKALLDTADISILNVKNGINIADSSIYSRFIDTDGLNARDIRVRDSLRRDFWIQVDSADYITELNDERKEKISDFLMNLNIISAPTYYDDNKGYTQQKYIISPESFDTENNPDVNDVSYLYRTLDSNRRSGSIDYDEFIPLIIKKLQMIDSSVQTLFNK